MSDTIYRQAAIEEIFKEPLYESGMKERTASAVVHAIYEKIKSLPSAQPEPITVNIDHELTQEEYVKLCKDMASAPIVLLPSAQPDVSDTNVGDIISRQDAIDAMEGLPKYFDTTDTLCLDYADVLAVLSEHLPSAQPDIIRCKDCRWWDKYGDYDNGYCMAAKHGCWTEHWEISIRRTYKGDFYCADAEPYKGEQE